MSELISKRSVYEAQSPEVIREHRARLLARMSLIENEIFLANDVLVGMGVNEEFYDADDDTPGSTKQRARIK